MLRKTIPLAQTCGRRLRAVMWRSLGARLGAKTAIGPHCSGEMISRIETGERFTLQGSNQLKVVSGEGQISIGDRVFVGTGSIIDASERIRIGNDVLIAPGVFITDHNHGIRADLRINQQPCDSSAVIIEDDVWLCANVCVLAGSRIASGAVVAAGAVVNGDVESFSIVGGVPAKKIGERK